MAITKKTEDFVLTNPKTINEIIDPVKQVKSRFYEPLAPYWLYVLKLEKNQYYVGYTGKENPYDRIMQHVSGGDAAAMWTKKYKPIDVVEIRDVGMSTVTEVKALEQNLTWAYIKLYGANSVRGGIINYTGKILRFGDKFIFGYMFDSFVAALMLILAASYILLRHYFNWW